MENGKNFPPDTIPRIEEEKRETGPPPEAPVPVPLTEAQRRFAAHYHALIYGFLLEKKLEIREYYDIAAIGYLHAVQRYFTEKSLHRYRFSTIAWRSMNSSLHTFQRQERRRESCEQSYLTMPRTPSDDAFDALQARLLLHDLFLLADEEQALLIRHRLRGCSLAETARREGISVKRVRRRLKVLYRAYFTQKEIKPEGVVTHEKYPYRSRDPDASSGGRQPRPHL